MSDDCDPIYGKVDDVLEQLTKSKSLHILMVLDRSSKPLRFSELKTLVDASSTTVSRRLKELEDFGLVEEKSWITLPVESNTVLPLTLNC